MVIGVILQTSSFSGPHMIVGVQHRQGNQHGYYSEWQTETSKVNNGGPLVVFETTTNIVGYCLSSWIDDTTEILADPEDKPIDNPEIIADRQEVVFSVEYERQNVTRWRDLLRRLAAHPVRLLPEAANYTLGVLDAYYCGDPPLLVSVRRRTQFALAHDHDVGEAAQDLRRRSVFAQPGYKTSGSL
ncbi:hypothetical protein DL762_007519 [Monosporascus cannonballus]|uniref:Heterokaryon incompatibility domain-containing protein n=1 Tax=Monosporascus cannonballus TaxID=155416 RepID=A0ABY0GZU0_9PEZI|nr:hypothetical protein DL762_007519 [Monosporascus cannonballus]